MATEARVAQQVGRAFPSITPIRVKDALDQFESVFAKVMVAVRIAGSVIFGIVLVFGSAQIVQFFESAVGK